jgi:hypothetical protein
MWIANDGRTISNPLRVPRELHGAMTETGLLLWVDLDGKRLRIKRHGIRFTLHDELNHQGMSGEAYCVELEDGSFWWACRDLMTGRWLGEPVVAWEPYL